MIAPQQPEIDAVAAQQCERGACKCVFSDRPRQHHRRAGAPRRQRLVGALAPRQQRVVAAEHGLPRSRQNAHRHQEIDIDRAEYEDHGGTAPR
jgi:hypothetical protein